MHRHPSATRPVHCVYNATRGAQDEAYPGVASVEVVAGLVANAGGDAPAGGVVNAAVDHLAVGGTLVNTLRETRNSSERASLSDPERGHLLCPDLQSAQCRRLNIPPALPPPTAPTHLAAKEAELGHTQKSEHVAVCYSRSGVAVLSPLVLWYKVRSSHIQFSSGRKSIQIREIHSFCFSGKEGGSGGITVRPCRRLREEYGTSKCGSNVCRTRASRRLCCRGAARVAFKQQKCAFIMSQFQFG